jgi:two-component system sensor histidine kinase CpxA
MLIKVEPEAFIIRTQDPQLNKLLRVYRQKPFPKDIIRSRPFIVSAPFVTSSGKHYRIVAKMPPRVINTLNFNWQALSIRALIALIISGIICYLLSSYISNPIRSLQSAAKKLGEGKLGTRVGNVFVNRKDEITDLAEEFDQMAERLQVLIQSQDQLLRDISHELRSPLARLFVALEMAKDKSGDTAQAELSRIELEANRLNDLIGALLSLARLEAKQDGVQLEKINLTNLVQAIVNDANYEDQANQRVEFHGDDKIILLGNKMLLSRAIENIVRNALRYSTRDKPVAVKLHAKDQLIQLTIRDHGPGIPEADLPHIFEPFYRVDGARNAKSGGYGLGLAIAQKSLSLLKGKICAANAEDGGLIVTISFEKTK